MLSFELSYCSPEIRSHIVKIKSNPARELRRLMPCALSVGSPQTALMEITLQIAIASGVQSRVGRSPAPLGAIISFTGTLPNKIKALTPQPSGCVLYLKPEILESHAFTRGIRSQTPY
jgi:hypothetical protein